MPISTKTPIDYAALEADTKPETIAPKGNGGTKVVKTDQPKVKNVLRYLSKNNMSVGGAVPVDEVNAYLSEMLSQGYKLFNTHFLNEAPEGFGVLYVLVLE